MAPRDPCSQSQSLDGCASTQVATCDLGSPFPLLGGECGGQPAAPGWEGKAAPQTWRELLRHTEGLTEPLTQQSFPLFAAFSTTEHRGPVPTMRAVGGSMWQGGWPPANLGARG